jgi:DNA-binding FadR family transcriptional regulator
MSASRPRFRRPCRDRRWRKGPFELLRAREFIEGAIAEQAARVAHAKISPRIDASLHAMANTQHPGDASMIHDRAFHVAVAGCLDNAVLVRVVGELFDQRLNPYFRKARALFREPGILARALASIRRSATPSPRAIRGRARQHARTSGASQERFAQNFGTEAAPALARRRGAADQQFERFGQAEPLSQKSNVTMEELPC